MKNSKKVNILLADYGESGKGSEFLKGLCQSTHEKWEIKCWKNNVGHGSKLFDFGRYFGYFWHPFCIFLSRGGYKTIVAWQQFYGLIFSFYCKLFHVKKENRCIVMTFIYKDKAGFVGKIYKAFISYCIHSKYIDRIVVYSKSEVSYYAALFHVSEKKFQFIPLGMQEESKKIKLFDDKDTPFLLSVGRSNRDYAFLFRSVADIPYQVIVLSDSIDPNVEIPANVKVYRNVKGDKYLKLLARSKCVLIPLKDPNISSGQLVILQAMRYGVPIIVTESVAVQDYVTDGIDAVVVKKEENEFRETIIKLMDNEGERQRISQNERKTFKAKFSMKTMGENVGKMIGEL